MKSRGHDHQSATDPSIFIKKDFIVLVYVDDYLVFLRKNSGISNRFIHSFTHGKEKIEFTNEGDLSKYLGVGITRHNDGSIEFNQPHLIYICVKLVDQD